MKTFFVISLLAAACFAAPTGNAAAGEAVNKDIVFRCLPSADLHLLEDATKPLFICRSEGRVLALALETPVSGDNKELHVVLEHETLRKLGEAFIARDARIIGTGSGASASAGSVGIGASIPNPLSILSGNPAPLISAGVSGSVAHAHSGAVSSGGFPI